MRKQGTAKVILLGAVLMSAFPAVSRPALADNDKVPTTKLRVLDGEQTGRAEYSDWVRGPIHSDVWGKICVSEHFDYMGDFLDDSLTVLPTEKLSIRIYTRQRPKKVWLYGWHKVNRHGYATGPMDELVFYLEDVNNADGKRIAWDVVIERDIILGPPGRSDYYINLVVRWWDRECKLPEQASWNFHITGELARATNLRL